MKQPQASSAKNPYNFQKSPRVAPYRADSQQQRESSPKVAKNPHPYKQNPLRESLRENRASPLGRQNEAVFAHSEQRESYQHSKTTTQLLGNMPIKSQAALQPNDQVEKAIFELQDVKNNYFQEKSLFDHKIQQIQSKQNQTLSSGFNPQAAYNRTATSGFLPFSTGGVTNSNAFSLRPMTQGGTIVGGGNQHIKNLALMNDNNVLKSDLDQVSKEDLKERLVVAEMVMKKLF